MVRPKIFSAKAFLSNLPNQTFFFFKKEKNSIILQRIFTFFFKYTAYFYLSSRVLFQFKKSIRNEILSF